MMLRHNKTASSGDKSTSLVADDYRALLSALNQTALVSVTDHRGIITFANDKFVEVSKYSRKELVGQNHRVLKSGQQPEVLFEDMWATISGGKIWRGEIKNRAKDGSYYWVDTSIVPIIGHRGRPERYIAVRFDITDKQKARELLQAQQNDLIKSKAKDEAILGAIGDGLVATDKDGRISLTNPEFEVLLGWSAAEVAGKKLTDVIPILDEDGEIHDTSHRLITQALSGAQKGVITSSESLYFRRKDGSIFPVAVTVSPMERGGQIIGAVKIFRDITHEKQIDRAKSEFVSLASHQLRTPLTAINWYTDMLQAGDAGPLNDEQQKYMSEIKAGSERMVELVNALLNVSRIDLGTFMIEPEPTDLINLCQKIVQESEPEIFERRQKFVEDYPKTLPPQNIDPRLTRMVIENLVSNAIKYTPVRGSITLTVTKRAGKVRIIVRDTGYGVPKTQQPKIFGKLFRADNVLAHDTEGTGLGLYIAKSVIEAAGGKIWFESVEHKGSAFYVELPAGGMKAHAGSRRLD